jgi:hypothetical protein
VVLRVRFDSTVFGKEFVVSQGGKGVAAEADGSFRIDFLKGVLRVNRSLSSAAAHASLGARVSIARRGDRIEVAGVSPEAARFSLTNLRGILVAEGALSSQDGSASFPYRGGQTLVVTLYSGRGAPLVSGIALPALSPR